MGRGCEKVGGAMTFVYVCMCVGVFMHRMCVKICNVLCNFI